MIKKILFNYSNHFHHSFSERFNPVYVKEMRQSIHSRAFGSLTFLFIIFELIICYFAYTGLFMTDDGGEAVRLADINTNLPFTVYMIIFMIAISVLPSSVLNRWALERNVDAMALEYTTPIAPGRLIRGKLYAMIALSCYMAIIGMPGYLFLAASTEKYAIIPITIISLAAMSSFYMLGMMGVILGTAKRQMKNTQHILVGLIVIAFPFFGFIISSNSSPEQIGNPQTLTMILWACFIFDAWCYSIIAGLLRPVMSNRFFPAHVTGMVLWILSLPVIAYSIGGNLFVTGMPKSEIQEAIFIAWGYLGVFYAVLNMFIGACDKFKMSQRMSSEISRHGVFKGIVYFFSGGVYPAWLYSTVIFTVGAFAVLYCVKHELYKDHVGSCVLLLCAQYFFVYAQTVIILRYYYPNALPSRIIMMVFAIVGVLTTISSIGNISSIRYLSPFGFIESNSIFTGMIYLACASAVLAVVMFIQAVSPKNE